MIELDLTKEHVELDNDELIGSLTWSNIEYNIGNGNYTLEVAKSLFPHYTALIDEVYKQEHNKLGFEQIGEDE